MKELQYSKINGGLIRYARKRRLFFSRPRVCYLPIYLAAGVDSVRGRHYCGPCLTFRSFFNLNYI
jgi:hypothetical protein